MFSYFSFLYLVAVKKSLMILVALFIISISAKSFQTSFLPVNEQMQNQYDFLHLNPYLLHFRTTDTLEIESISKNYSETFIPLNAVALNQGPSSFFHWMALPLENNTVIPQRVFSP